MKFTHYRRMYRNRIEVIAEILKIARKGATKTQIMYDANLSFLQLKKFINFLQAKRLIKVIESQNGKLYVITPSGESFLEYYSKLEKFVK